MKNKTSKSGKNTMPVSGPKPREDKKIDLKKNQYPMPAEKDDQLKNQPEFIDPNSNKKGS